jgi:sarcosine oxidase
VPGGVAGPVAGEPVPSPSMNGVPRKTFDVVVVGAGVIGLATALELAHRGRSVLAIDRFGSGHPATSSTGASRSIRIAYDHPLYVRLALDAIEAWRGLEEATGRTILHLTGQVDLGPTTKLEGLVRTVRAAGAEIDEIDRGELRGRFPELVLADGEAALLQRQAGTVIASAAMEAMLDAAERAGLAYLPGRRVTAIEPGSPVVVRTAGCTFRADQVVLAAGPWLGALAEGLGIHLPLAPAIAQVTFLDAPGLVDRPALAEWPAAAERGIYGHPVPGVGYKVAYDAGAEGWDPDVESWAPDSAEEGRLLAWLARRMPSVEPRISLTQRHPWTMTPDADWIVDRRGPVVIAGGCSGHAFKFGPALGRLVADVVDGGAAPALFRIERDGLAGTASATAPISR